jgi:multidrug efflux pump
VQVPGLISSAADVYSLPLKTSGDTVVTFGDVAQITRTFQDATSYAHVNGQPAITLSIRSCSTNRNRPRACSTRCRPRC